MKRGRLPEDLSLHYQSQVLAALEYLIKKKVAHLDIKGVYLNKSDLNYAKAKMLTLNELKHCLYFMYSLNQMIGIGMLTM